MSDGTPTSIAPVQLTTIDAELYTVPAGIVSILKELLICNLNTTPGGLAAGVEIQRRTAAGNDFYLRVKDETVNQLAAFNTEMWELDTMLHTGDSIRGIATTSGINVSLTVIQCTTNTDTDPTPLVPVTLSSAAVSDLLTVDSGYINIVKEVVMCNHNTNSTNGVELVRRTAASADFSIRANNDVTVLAKGQTEILHLNLVLDEDEKLRATCSSSGVDVTTSVIRIRKT